MPRQRDYEILHAPVPPILQRVAVDFGYVLLQTSDKPTVKCIEFKFVVTSTCSKGILGRGCKIYLKMMLVKSRM